MGDKSDVPALGRRERRGDDAEGRESLISHVEMRITAPEEGSRWFERAAEASLAGHWYAELDGPTIASMAQLTRPDEWAERLFAVSHWDAGARACLRAMTGAFEFDAPRGLPLLMGRICPAEVSALLDAVGRSLRGAGPAEVTVFVREAPESHPRLRWQASFAPNNPDAPEEGGVLYGSVAPAQREPRATGSTTELHAGFLASLSHEIRTPLSGVLGMLDLMMSSSLSDDQRELGHMAQGAARTLRRLIDDVLDLSKIEAGKLELERIPLSVRRVVRDAARAIAPAAHAKGLDVILDVNLEQDEREGDPTRISQVLLNLLGNAVKFTETGHISVTVSHAPPLSTSPRTPAVRIRVEDTGIGIAPDRAATLFVPFAQADASVSRRFGGTGLGLAICKQLCAAMGGHIEAAPGDAIGTVFDLVIPLPMVSLDARLRRERRRVDVAQTGAIPTTFHQRLPQRVSIIAAPRLSQSLSEGLRRAGFEVFGGPGLHPDAEVLVLDTFFARENDTVSALSAEAQRAGIPVLALTDTSQLLPDGVRAMVTRTLIKPVLPYDIYRLLCELAEGETTPTRALSIAPPPPNRALRVLVAEDNPVNALLAKSLLSRLGHSPVVATNGREALSALQSRESFDVVLMDVVMPEMDGLEATRAIRRSASEFRDIPIVALTAKALDGDEAACREAGMSAYLTKPFNIHELRETLARLVNGSAEHPFDA